MAQKEEAEMRRENKKQNQLKCDMEPAVQELKEFEVARKVQVQLATRNFKKEQGREGDIYSHQTYQPGQETLQNSVAGFFTPEGRQAAVEQSEKIKNTMLEDLQRQTAYSYLEDDKSDSSRDLAKGASNYLQSAGDRRNRHEAMNIQLEEARRELQNATLPREAGGMRAKIVHEKFLNQIDTVHPNRYRGPITDVRQNLFYPSLQSESQYPSGMGITGSSLGYG